MDLKELEEENAVRLVGFTVPSTEIVDGHPSDENTGSNEEVTTTKREQEHEQSDDLTIKVNGSVLNHDLDSSNGSGGVRLVGFTRSSSLGRADLEKVLKFKGSRSPPPPSSSSLSSKMRFGRLKAEARELLSRSKRRPSDANGEGEHFDKFFKENKERFIEMFENFSRVLSGPSLTTSELREPGFSAPSSPTPQFETNRLCSVSNGSGSSSTSKKAYQMSSSKSVFEFCADTNTLRFCTERMTQSYEQSFDVSESEDEDEGTETASCSSREEDTFSADSDQRGPSSIRSDSFEKASSLSERAAFKVAQELLTTERTYVQVLHLIDQVFQFRVDHENRARPMFPQEIITRMFSNVKSIYKLHHDFLLPQLEQRLSDWSNDPRIGDIVKNFAPFLKMYTEYVKNFDDANTTVSLWLSKSPRFATIVDEIQKLPECCSLTLQHHMLAPVQRVPRYELLLKDYLRKLPNNSSDREDTEKSLHLVATAANQSNEAAKKIDNFKKLLEVQDLLGGSADLVSPTRELVRSGKLVKISARNGDHQDRHLFLFTDLVLLCSQRRIANRVVSSTHSTFRIRARLQVDGLEVTEGDNLVTANTFYIRNNHKSIELYTQTPEDRDEWIKALENTIDELKRRKSSLRITDDDLNNGSCDLGSRAPIPTVANPENVEACVVCRSTFGAFRRRQKCHACGSVVCAKCNGQKVPLKYDGNRPHHVCRFCHDVLTSSPSSSSVNSFASSNGSDSTDVGSQQNGNSTHTPTSPVSSAMGTSMLRRGILEVRALDVCVQNGHLHLKTRGKTWTSRWFVLKDDFVLYSFASKEDVRAMTSTPVPGFQVALGERSNGLDRDYVFKLFHKKKTYFFQAPSESELKRWMEVLERASRAELSTPP